MNTESPGLFIFGNWFFTSGIVLSLKRDNSLKRQTECASLGHRKLVPCSLSHHAAAVDLSADSHLELRLSSLNSSSSLEGGGGCKMQYSSYRNERYFIRLNKAQSAGSPTLHIILCKLVSCSLWMVDKAYTFYRTWCLMPWKTQQKTWHAMKSGSWMEGLAPSFVYLKTRFC